MKLRIQGNSLRLRVTQKEVALVRDGGHVESFIEFAPGRPLVYLLEGSPSAETMSATFDGCAIRVTIPMHQMTDWLESDQVGIEARSQTGVQLLVLRSAGGLAAGSLNLCIGIDLDVRAHQDTGGKTAGATID